MFRRKPATMYRPSADHSRGGCATSRHRQVEIARNSPSPQPSPEGRGGRSLPPCHSYPALRRRDDGFRFFCLRWLKLFGGWGCGGGGFGGEDAVAEGEG